MGGALLLLLLSPWAIAASADSWELSELMVYLWGTPKAGAPESRARVLALAGFTVVDATPDQLDLLQRHGLKGMLHRPSPEIVARTADHPALWGYHLADEPYPEEQFAALAEEVRALRQLDPHHPSFINMLSTTGEFLRTYMKEVEPDILSFDYYPWWWGSDRYFEKLEQFREQAALARVPLASCLEVSANPAIERGDRTRLEDNAAKLRQSVFTNLAYGVKALEWFNADMLFEPDGEELSAAGRDVAALNAEAKKLGPVLVTLRSLDVFHTPPLPRGTREAPKEHWVQVLGEEGAAGLVLGMFEDATGVDYFLVANRDYRLSQSVVVRLQSKWLGIAPWHKPKAYTYGIERFDKASAHWETVSSSSFVGFTFVIAPADGELFRMTTRIQP
jgi:hypothetical protein